MRLAIGYIKTVTGAGLYTIKLELPGRPKGIGTGNVTLRDPLARAGNSVEPGEIVSSSQTHGTSKGLAQSFSSYWVAHRTN